MQANKELTADQILEKINNKYGAVFTRSSAKSAMEEYANAKLHLLQQEYDKLKGENEMLQKIVDQFRNLLRINAGAIEDFENRLFGIKELEHDYAALKAKVEKLAAEHADLNLALAAMLNGYANLPTYQMDWFTVPRDVIDKYTKMVLDYNSNTNNQNENNGH